MVTDVKVKIELSRPAGTAGFGFPLIVGCVSDAETTPIVDYTECYSIEDVKTKGFDEESEVYKAANKIFMQEHSPEKVAVMSCSTTGGASGEHGYLSRIKARIDRGWRQLIIVCPEVNWGELAEYIETTNKMLFIQATNLTDFSDMPKSYDRTVIFVNSTPHANAALVGETAGRPAGSFTYKFKTLKGVEPNDTWLESQIRTMHEANRFGYITMAGDAVTSEGFAVSGKYIDQTDSIDYVVSQIEYRIQKVFNGTAKVHYDDRGIALLGSAITSALQDAAVNGIIATKEDGSYDYSVSVVPRSATTEADRASRSYKYGTFRFALAGAIHSCEVNGEITY